MARLAFLTSLAPTLRADTGFEIANRCVIDGLRRQGHSVRIFAFARPADELRPDPDLVLLGRMEIENRRVGRLTQARWLASALRRGLPVACAKLRVAGARVLARVKADGPFDGIVASGVSMIGAHSRLFSVAPVLFVQHNVEHQSARENADFSEGAAMRALFRREARLLERIERETCAASRHVWFLSEDDRRAFLNEAGERSCVLPLVNGEAMSTPEAPPEHDIGLIGTWTWEPNLIGLRWFLEEIAPFLPRGFRIAVAGRTPPGLRAPENVAFLGRVPDAAGFVAGCRAIALVSRAGSGVQLKTLETLQAGLPAVATSLSMRGVADRPDNVVVADDSRRFAAAMTQLVSDVRAGKAGRVDGGAFAARQLRDGDAALARGVAAL